MFQYNETTYTQDRLNGMSSMGLVALHNAICRQLGGEHDKPVNRFSDKKTGVERTTKLGKMLEERSSPVTLEAKVQAQEAKMRALTPEEPKAKPAPAPRKKVEPRSTPQGPRKVREMRFVFPAKDEIKGHRPGTHRSTLVELLSREEGATFEECQKATGWDKKTTYEGIRLLHYYVGYGMKQDDDGRIHLKSSNK